MENANLKYMAMKPFVEPARIVLVRMFLGFVVALFISYIPCVIVGQSFRNILPHDTDYRINNFFFQ